MRTSDKLADSNPPGHRAKDRKAVEPGQVQVGPSTGAKTPEVDLDALVHAIAVSRDRGAFVDLHNWFVPRLTALGLQFGLGFDSASELAQETMINVWRRAQSFDPSRSTLSTWIFTVMRDTRVELTGQRNNAAEAGYTSDLLVDDHIVGAFSRKPISEAFIGEMANLPANHRRVAAKQFFENKGHSAIAAEFSIPLETIRLWSKQALERLPPVLMEPATQ